MEIIASNQYLGMPKFTNYLVEAAPERRLVWFREKTYSHDMGEPLEIPIPRALYVVIGPSSLDKALQSERTYATTHMYALENDGEPVTDDTPVYLLPWPNQHVDGHFSLCAHSSMPMIPDATLEQVVEDIIIRSWSITFGYLRHPNEVQQWISSSSISENISRYYTKWEKLTLDEACEMPWGKYPPKFYLPKGLGWTSTEQTVGDIKEYVLNIKKPVK